MLIKDLKEEVELLDLFLQEFPENFSLGEEKRRDWAKGVIKIWGNIAYGYFLEDKRRIIKLVFKAISWKKGYKSYLENFL